MLLTESGDKVPAAFESMRNKKGQTPEEIFYSTHRDLMVSAKVAIKNKANNGMLVTTIITTIVFAATLILLENYGFPMAFPTTKNIA